jgi:hypothetical protein
MTRTQSKRNNRAAELVAAFERSGSTRKAFCKSMGISVTTLDYYRRRVKVERGGQVGWRVKRKALPWCTLVHRLSDRRPCDSGRG